MRQSGALLEVGAGFANVLTGTAYGPVEVELAVLASEPDTSEVTEWEVIEEAPLRVDSSAYILKMDGEQVEGFSAIPPGRYRIRAHARGRDGAWDRQVTVPVEQHMIWVWPDTSRRGLRQLKKTDNAWDESAQDLTPDLGTVVFIDPDGTVRKVDPTSDEVRQAHANRVPWDGHEPSEKLRTRHVSQNVSRIDRRLLDVFESADAQKLDEITAWSVRCACERAGIDQIDWITALLTLLEADEKRCIPHAMPTLKQCGVRRAVDLADGTTATTARSPQILHCGYHFDPSAPLDVISDCHHVISDCHHELTHHTPHLSAGSG